MAICKWHNTCINNNNNNDDDNNDDDNNDDDGNDDDWWWWRRLRMNKLSSFKPMNSKQSISESIQIYLSLVLNETAVLPDHWSHDSSLPS